MTINGHPHHEHFPRLMKLDQDGVLSVKDAHAGKLRA
jgi:hypothetical protein